MNKSISFQGWRLGHTLLAIILSLGVIHTVEAQQSSKVRRVGYVATGSEENTRELREIARRTYADLGYRDGKNLRIDMRYAEGRFEQGPRLFTELLEADAEVLGTSGYQLAAAAIQVTRNVPVVGVGCGIELLATSLAKPGGNLTGVTCQTPDLATKHLELFLELFPGERRVGVLYNPDAIYTLKSEEELTRAAGGLGIEVSSMRVRRPEEIEFAFADIEKQGARAIILATDALLFAKRERLVALASIHRIAVIATFREFAEHGAIVSYGSKLKNLVRRQTEMIVRILEGAKPADIPIEQPTSFELIINLKTAKALGLDVPPSLLARADEVIE
ncbi:ABC transporter substrate-binding protein [Bradyrhizobium liaoningense]|uniref:ABC transporter substrate-binding protein n=1 Tax=Bradyrhizobium liaoningense TaxID=43992 RepID=UPI001BA97D98|nr:ABC transporter substrate-binding protein [Bradyrhizobium liaoningense]MBR0719864.1 ABC transporter substrate-binding protein [Bradyrhizobium liaoningense]